MAVEMSVSQPLCDLRHTQKSLVNSVENYH